MSLLSNILEKLGFNPPTAQAPPTLPATPPPQAAPATSTAPAAIPVIDVGAKLEGLAKANPQTLHWRDSIVDLLKLLGLESSLAARKALATELGCPADKMGDSAQMNLWLHKSVLQKLAQNGGTIPQELLD